MLEAKFRAPEAVVGGRYESYQEQETGLTSLIANVRVLKGFGCGAIVTARERSGGPLKPPFPLRARRSVRRPLNPSVDVVTRSRAKNKHITSVKEEEEYHQGASPARRRSIK